MLAAFNTSTSTFNASLTAHVVSHVSDSRRGIERKKKREKKKEFARARANAWGRNHERAVGCRLARWIINRACATRDEYRTDVSRDEIPNREVGQMWLHSSASRRVSDKMSRPGRPTQTWRGRLSKSERRSTCGAAISRNEINIFARRLFSVTQYALYWFLELSWNSADWCSQGENFNRSRHDFRIRNAFFRKIT